MRVIVHLRGDTFTIHTHTQEETTGEEGKDYHHRVYDRPVAGDLRLTACYHADDAEAAVREESSAARV